ncbi:o-succinylbenzoate--CoA ligase [Bacillus inaquosorum]|uniref:o-succinylbenzoate--CoA ligase n=1 Tax=Bacillus inaquosorum TaxID=483913 RepID=UPI002282614C|nr:o-succinylbenzoate--CoA ligase [Bacillus inaquosorum]MCY7941858.1 o-succinylbenzoate--CoA ligase [Bacillus inaquosorum]MCY7965280.1 o-succinylbenzoate--CoA ligase [Bacillus inaquosorum]MCY7983515.1 o-succinylbenzoate--CoA ligase [Bacillus inaquosorum]MCY8029720.1 o-succinylbenzoate--CoA ligase [Bacillus inaquosorum]MCY8176118.1 o-succinylbenzoate--CoA ligase [Bacillus inaquosorum]
MLTEQPNWLMQRAQLTPERIALIYGDQTVTFADLFAASKQMAAKLAAHSVRKGDTAAILLQNRTEMVYAVHACFLLGVKAVLLNTKLSTHERLFQLEDSGARFLLTDSSFDKQDYEHTVQTIDVDELAQVDAKEIKIEAYMQLDETATLMYTSGTTGKPKGVQQTFGNHYFSAVSSALNLGITEQDRWLIALPLFHISGLSALFKSVIYGMTVVLHQRFSVSDVLDSIARHQVTMISAVQTMLASLLEETSRCPETIRCILLGGGPAPLPLLEECREKGFPVFQSYGMTETCSQIVTLSPEFSMEKLGSAGKPLFSCEIKIERDGQACKPFEHGEIMVKGPNVMKSYFNRESANEASFQNGWLKTGDLGYLDSDGFLYVLDRRSDLIISGGENIYPAEVESVLLSHPAVAEAGVSGAEDQKWGKVPHAYLVLHKPVSAEELTAYCKERLAKYKIPAKFFILDSLPRNASNKLLRNQLKDARKGELL